jgi:DNA-binding beta-propeller fold protein YncE
MSSPFLHKFQTCLIYNVQHITGPPPPAPKFLWVPAHNYNKDHLMLFKIDLTLFSVVATKDFGFTTEIGWAINWEGMYACNDATDVYVVDCDTHDGAGPLEGRVSRVRKSDLATIWSQDTGTQSEPMGIISIGNYVYVCYFDQCQVDQIRKADGAVVNTLLLDAGVFGVSSRLYSSDGTKIYVYVDRSPNCPGPYLHRVDVATFTEDVGSPITFCTPGTKLSESFGYFTSKGNDTLHFAGDVWVASGYVKKCDIPTFTMGILGGPYPPGGIFSHNSTAYYSSTFDALFCFEHGFNGTDQHYIHKINESTYVGITDSINLQPTIDPWAGAARWGNCILFDDGLHLFCQTMGTNVIVSVEVLRMNPNTLAFNPAVDLLSILDSNQAGLGCYG